MSPHVHEWIPEMALGGLAEADARTVEAHVAVCAECRAALAAEEEGLAALALTLSPIEPAAGARERLLAVAAKTGARHRRFAGTLARLLDVAVEQALGLLDRVDRDEEWAPLPLPGVVGIEMMETPIGPRLQGATVVALRLQPGARFPRHRHGGAEQVFVLQGGFSDDGDGREYHPGQIQEADEGSAHSFVGLAGEPCICIGILAGSLELLDCPTDG